LALKLTDTMTEVVAQRFRLLGEPMRLRILQLLEAGERPVGEIVETLKSSQPNISKHLQALCQGGLIRRRREGLNVYYAIADPIVFRLCELVCRAATEHTRARFLELAPGTLEKKRGKNGGR